MKALHPSREGRGQGNLRRGAAAKSTARARSRRKGLAMRKVVSIIAIVAVVLVVAAVLLIDVIARVGIEVAGSKVLGVPTSVRNVDIGLLRDHSSVSGLEVANPPGYTDPMFLSLGQVGLTARSTAEGVEANLVVEVTLPGFAQGYGCEVTSIDHWEREVYACVGRKILGDKRFWDSVEATP